jgi:AcrR family transcriptional regulator
MASKPGRASIGKAEQAAATRARLIAVARKHFANDGYEAAATEAIVAGAQVTRGALYHLFTDKRDLFRAVVVDAHTEVLAAVEKAAGEGIDGIVAGSDAFLAASQREDILRPYLIDGPAVLGWLAWRALDQEYGAGSLREGLLAAQRAGEIVADVDIDALAHAINGMLNETALAMAGSTAPRKLRANAVALLRRMLDGLRPRR